MKNDAMKTLFVAAILCVACSILVSGAAVLLKPAQEANKVLDVKKNLLLASGLIEEPVTPEEINQAYTQIQAEVIELETGEPTDIEAATFSQEKASKDPEMNKVIDPKADIAGIKVRSRYAPAYKYLKDGSLEMLVLPIKGKGLWSTLYGFLALDKDLRTVRGLGFYAHGETPGLGGEIDNPKWKAIWKGKKAFDENFDDVKITVVKGAVDSSDPKSEYKVDGLSGATITSNGVTFLVQYWLGDDGFGPYLARLRSQQDLTDSADPSSEETQEQ